jgi:hypothetical protein
MRAHLAKTTEDIEPVLGEGALGEELRGREEL